MKAGIVLFAHGSRDPEWARPFEALAATLSGKVDASVKLAYLELMQPSLEQAIGATEANGGKVLQPRHAVGPYGFRALVLDSEGNRIALHSM